MSDREPSRPGAATRPAARRSGVSRTGDSWVLDSGPPAGGGSERVEYRIQDMDCPDCARRIQEHLRRVDGVLDAVGNPVSRKLRVRFDGARVDAERIVSEVGRLGYVAREAGASGADGAESTWRSAEAVRAYISTGLFAAGVLLRLIGVTPVLTELPLHDLHPPDLLFLTAALVGGWNFFPRGLRSARTLSLDMNFLMSLAILGAAAIGEFPEAAAIAFLFSIAELLEKFAVDRARGSIESLVHLSPERARVIRNGSEVTVAADRVERGETVVIRPGERIPVDGEVTEGASSVNEAPITGESMPVEKSPGDDLFAGTINTSGFLRARVTRAAGDTLLARIIHLVEEAESRKAPSEQFVDRFARWYTPVVTGIAVVVAALPVLAFGEPFAPWFVRGLTLLVIACPCALVISTPVAVVSGITAAARNGVLIKGGVHLEDLGRVEVLAFDKTGTLTHGHPEVTDVVPLGDADREEVLAVAAAVEGRSEHPIAAAILREARHRELAEPRWGVTDFQAVPGRGASARLDGIAYRVGSPAMFAGPDEGEEGDRLDDDAHRVLDRLSREGKTPVVVGRADRLLGIVAVSDRPREEAADAIRGLKAAGLRKTVMLTGDRRETAEAVARDLGFDEVYSELLPDQKVEVIGRLEEEHGAVAMVGDGVNDGPALAAARVGIAMGAAGSDTAIETADVALMSDDLSRLPYLYRLSHRGRGVIRQNIGASLIIKFLLAAGVPLGMVSLVAAVLVGDMGTSLGVTLNSLRLGRVQG